MAKLKLLFISLIIIIIFFSRFSLISSLPIDEVLNATRIVSRSGFVAMALTVELVAQTLISNTSSVTIFCPPDTAFAQSGQPPLSLLQYHFSPHAFSLQALRSLRYGTPIPTLLPNRSLFVTTSASDELISLNNVKINGSELYDDGSLVIFGLDNFFNPNFNVSAPIQNPSPNLTCVVSTNNPSTLSGVRRFNEASGTLRSNGYSVMASFLDLQLPPSDRNETTMLTVFAPRDDAMKGHIGNFTVYPSLFFRHVLPCRVSRTGLESLENGTMLRTLLDGFVVNITRSGDELMLNGVAVTVPDMYYSDWLVVHGIRDVLAAPERPYHGEPGSSSEPKNYNSHNVSASDRLKPPISYLFSAL
ncbi:putative fasciclin-like arabinogalactan protein 20 [Cornus florida]|uniref:putative fasciclin-like arabinogalactan protein 20 n=1 Tax=Cornus florida TaxID=4283 RepID=UPI00289CABD8|nr:putative fasciclin-like arabinogalactan protein 20 [Cornus florida]